VTLEQPHFRGREGKKVTTREHRKGRVPVSIAGASAPPGVRQMGPLFVR
jgi:hypothetical protein